MTLANKITISRLSLSLLVFILIITQSFWLEVLALFLLIIASSSDGIDGYVARKTGTTTAFGAIADPFADKVLVLGLFLAFAMIKELYVPLWAVFLILLRELTISTLRVLAALHGEVLKAERSGKIKTTLQMIAVFTIMTALVIITGEKEYGLPSWLSWLSDITPLITTRVWWKSITWWCTVVPAVYTIYSGVLYIRGHKELLVLSWSEKKKQ